MAITHAASKASGDRGFATDWNAEHVVTDESKPKNFTTLIVAASNSLDTSRADYVCDGVNDQEEINAAILALPAQGGRISLLEGTFTTTAVITIAGDSISLFGVGRATRITGDFAGNMINITGDWCTVNNIYVHRTGVTAALDVCMKLTGSYNFVSQCYCHGNRTGIWLTNTFNIVIQNTCELNLGVESAGIHFDDASGGNVVKGNVCRANGTNGIKIKGNWNVVVGNSLILNTTGITLRSDSNYNTVTGNMCYNNSATGIMVGTAAEGADGNVIASNVCNSSATGILIVHANCDNNLIHGNMLLGNVAALTDNGTNTHDWDNVKV